LRKIVVVALVVLALSFCAVAADTPKAEVFGGYSFMRVDTGNSTHVNSNGWDGELNIPFFKYLGITADVNGQYATVSGVSAYEYSFLFGPSIAFRNPSKITPFARVLFGVNRISGSGSGVSAADSAFAVDFGGGVDIKVGHMLSIRPAQLDWLRSNHTSLSGSAVNNIRYAAGIVLRF
jgi:hypothetical protein